MSTWSNDGKPVWLIEDGKQQDDVEADRRPSKTNSNSKKSIHDAETVTRSNTSFDDDDDNTKSKGSRPSISPCTFIFALISLGFAGLFITRSIYFYSDKSLMDRQWMGYYCFQAGIGLLSVLSRLCCRGMCERMISSFAALGLLWAFILVIVTCFDYKKTMSDDRASINGYYDDLTKNADQSAFDLAFSLIGCMNCLYHLTLFYCCGMK